MEKSKKETLWLIWKDTVTKEKFKIGELSKENDKYVFEYDTGEVKLAMNHNFKPLLFFPSLNKRYERKGSLFPDIASRLPDRRRVDIKKILEKYNLKEYDEFELIKRSGAKLPTDTFEFVEPILFREDNELISRTFDISIIKNLLENKKPPEIIKKDKLKLIAVVENNKLPVVKILNSKGEYLGKVPRYYSTSIFKALKEGMDIECEVLGSYRESQREEVVKVKLNIRTLKKN